MSSASPARSTTFVFHVVQIASGAYPASHTIGSGSFTLGVRRPGRETCHSHLTSALIRLHDVVLSYA
jgi:hypothetical protein